MMHSQRKSLCELRAMIDKAEANGVSDKSFAQAVAEARRKAATLKSKLSP